MSAGPVGRRAGPDRQHLLGRLRERLDRFNHERNPAVVLDPQAVADAAALLETVSDPAADLEAAYLVGWLRWARYCVLDPGNDEQELAAALPLFAALYQARPDLLPGQVRAYFDRERPAVPDEHQVMERRGLALLEHARQSGDPAELNNAIDLLEQAVAASPTNHPDRGMFLSNLGGALATRFQETGVLADLGAAVDVMEQGVAATPTDDPRLAGRLSNLSGALCTRFQETGTLADLDAAVSGAERAVTAAPADQPGRGVCLSTLGWTLEVRYEQTGTLADLDAAITAREQAVAATATDHPDLAARLSYLGVDLKTRYGRTHELADLQAAIEVMRQAVTVTPTDHPDLAKYLSELGLNLLARYGLTGALSDFDAAIDVFRQAIAATPTDHPDRPRRLSNLGRALGGRYELTGTLADLEAAIDILRLAVAGTSTDDPDHATYLSNLGAALGNRFRQTGVLADLETAIDVFQQAVAGTPTAHPDRPGRLSDLGRALVSRCERTGMLADVDAAIDVMREAVATTPRQDPRYAARLSGLGNALRTRYERTGLLEDIDAAVTVGEQALAACPDDDPDRAGMMSALGSALRARFERTRVLADIDAAVSRHQQAVAATPTDQPDHARRLSNLGVALRTRYQHSGALADLDAAIAAGEQAVAATPSDSPDRPATLSNLGVALRSRYEASRVLADLDAAITVGEQAVAATPENHPSRAIDLSNLGNALQVRYERTGVLADLDAAITAAEQAVAATPETHPNRAPILSNLGFALRMRYERTRAPTDLDTAIDISRDAVAATRAAPRTESLLNLCAALQTRYERTQEAADLDEAVTAGRDAAALVAASPRVRALAARNWGRAAAVGERWPEAVEGFTAAVEQLARVVPRSLTRADQEHLLVEFGGLGSHAAACCLNAGRAERALELFEQGRGILLSQALDSRTDLTALAQRNPDLARRFTDLANELDRAEGGVEQYADVSRHATERRREVADAFDRILAEIRSQPGFEGFLHPPAVAELAAAVGDGTLVLVNVSRFGAHAVILTGPNVDASGPLVVPLPGLSPEVTVQRVVDFQIALDTCQDAESKPGQRVAAEAVLTDMLGWLWDQITGPVLDQLGIHGPPAAGEPWPRLWWCLSGVLSFLPLHAAGHHDTRRHLAPATVIDRVISSYVPTIRTLVHARRPIRTAAGRKPSDGFGGFEAGGRVLAVAMPHTPGASDLPGAQEETADLQRRFPGRVTVLSGPAATYNSVLAMLPVARWAHFACHSLSDLNNPSASHLLLHDHQTQPLTVVDVTRLRLEEAELAFLSACSTARPGVRLADEAIQLASAFQLAGYRHVIGTLWPIDDQASVALADDIYTNITCAGDPAGAVHAATRRLRNHWSHQPSVWASHIHVGGHT